MQALMVYLVVTFGVKQHQLVVRILAAEVFGFDVMSVPSGGFGNRLTMIHCVNRQPDVLLWVS